MAGVVSTLIPLGVLGFVVMLVGPTSPCVRCAPRPGRGRAAGRRHRPPLRASGPQGRKQVRRLMDRLEERWRAAATTGRAVTRRPCPPTLHAPRPSPRCGRRCRRREGSSATPECRRPGVAVGTVPPQGRRAPSGAPPGTATARRPGRALAATAGASGRARPSASAAGVRAQLAAQLARAAASATPAARPGVQPGTVGLQPGTCRGGASRAAVARGVSASDQARPWSRTLSRSSAHAPSAIVAGSGPRSRRRRRKARRVAGTASRSRPTAASSVSSSRRQASSSGRPRPRPPASR